MVSLRWNAVQYFRDLSSLIDPFKELFQVIVLFIFFFGVVYVTIPKMYTDSPKGKYVVVAIALILSFGMLFAKPYINFFFESFALVGFFIIISVMFLLIFNMVRQYNVDKSVAFASAYSIVFFSFLIISPSLLDTLDRTIPFVVTILVIISIFCIGYLAYKGFQYIFSGYQTDTKGWANHLRHNTIHNVDKDMINKEIKQEREERGEIEKKAIPSIQISAKDIDSIDKGVNHIANILRQNPVLADTDKIHVIKVLREIASFEAHAKKSLDNLLNLTRKWEKIDKGKVEELARRESKTHEAHKKELIKKEVQLQRMKMQILDYVSNHGVQVHGFIETFDNWIGKAVKSIEGANTRDAYECLRIAKQILNNTKNALLDLFRHEKKAIEITNFEEKMLTKEVKG